LKINKTPIRQFALLVVGNSHHPLLVVRTDYVTKIRKALLSQNHWLKG
jgi:hypothetical protein